MTMSLKTGLPWMAVSILATLPASAPAQSATPAPTNALHEKAVMAQLIALRDSFVDQIKAEGFQPSLPPPEIILDNPASYGAFDRAKNVLQSLVPAGQQNEKFLNENYEKLAPTPAFIWFQCDMVSKMLTEKPLPSFRQTLQQPLYP